MALALGLAFVLAPAPAASQSVVETIYTDLKHGVGDILAVWTSPFRGDGSDYLTAGMVAGAVGVTAIYDDEIGAWIRNNPNAAPLVALEPFREDHPLKLINLGAGKSLLQLSGGLYLVGLVLDDQAIRDAAVGCTAAEKSNGLMRHFVYKGVSRERPLVIETIDGERVKRPGDPYDISVPGDDNDWYDNSFFGGHGANVMSCASFFNHRFDLGLAEPVIWGVAAAINLGRLADERHWASDAAIGLAVGYAIGKYVAERSLERERERQQQREARDGDGGRRGRTNNADGADGADGADDADPGDGSTDHASALDTLLDGLFVARAADGGMTIGWRGKF